MNRHYGYIKDRRDERDYLLTARKAVELPDVVDLSEYLPAVRNQGSQGSCVGHGIGGILTGKAKQLNCFEEWFSPRWIYYGGRYLGGYVNQDCGTEPRLALEWLSKYGCLLESCWKYEEKFNPAAPAESLFTESIKWPLFSYTRVVDGIDGICSALASGNFVAIGSPWFSKWNNTDNEGRLKKPYCWNSIDGGHEYLLYGYNKNIGYFEGMNSWGAEWGKGGKMLVPFQAIPMFKKRGGYDAHIVEVNWRAV